MFAACALPLPCRKLAGIACSAATALSTATPASDMYCAVLWLPTLAVLWLSTLATRESASNCHAGLSAVAASHQPVRCSHSEPCNDVGANMDASAEMQPMHECVLLPLHAPTRIAALCSALPCSL